MHRFTLAVLAVFFFTLGFVALPVQAGEIKFERRDWIIHFLVHFGHGSGEEQVTEAQFDTFLQTIVTPFFPEGLTLWPSHGQWADLTSGKVNREKTSVVEIQGPDNQETRDKVNFVAKQYMQRFMNAQTVVYIIELGRLPATLFFVSKNEDDAD